MNKCKIENCGRVSWAKNLCNMHYLRKRNNLDMNTTPKTQWRKIHKINICLVENCNQSLYGHGVCRKHYNQARTCIRKNILIEYKGGPVCNECKQTTCWASLQFHHIDPQTKLFEIGNKINNYSLAKLKLEADKCHLICANCHYKIHAGDYSWLNSIKHLTNF